MCLHEDKLSLFNGVYRLSLCLLNSNSYDKSSIQVNLDWCTKPTGIKCNLQLRKGEQQTNEKIQGYYVNKHRMMRHLWSRSGKKKRRGGGLVVKAWVVSGCKRIDVRAHAVKSLYRRDSELLPLDWNYSLNPAKDEKQGLMMIFCTEYKTSRESWSMKLHAKNNCFNDLIFFLPTSIM